MNPRKSPRRRSALGARLLELRERAGFEHAKDLADRLGWTPSTLSRFESGTRTPNSGQLRAIATACGASPEFTAELLELLVNDRIERRPLSGTAESQTSNELTYEELHEAAEDFWECTAGVVPALIQTAGYARALFAQRLQNLGEEPNPVAVEAATNARTRLQQHLYDESKRFNFLLDESVLTRLLVPRDTLREQLDRLQTIIGSPRVRFGILPLGAPVTTAVMASLCMYAGQGWTRIDIESNGDEMTIHDAEGVARHMREIDLMWRNALEGDAARERIIAASRMLGAR